ncbi:MAG: hypothetical protein ACHQZQ_04365 [SAR324 cluster bacterium]
MTQSTGWTSTLHEYQTYTLPWEEFRKVPFSEFADRWVQGEYRDVLANSPNRATFEQKFKLYGLGMEILQARYAFFSKLLTGDTDLRATYQSEIGTGDLEKRLLFALHYVFVRAARVLRSYNDMIGNYPEYLKRLQTLVEKGVSDCRTVQVCVCAGAKEPYISSCLSFDNSVLLPYKPRAPRLATQADIDKLFG